MTTRIEIGLKDNTTDIKAKEVLYQTQTFFNLFIDHIQTRIVYKFSFDLLPVDLIKVFSANPNGSQDCMAGLCDPSGRIFGMMPHPEAFLHAENHPQWRRRKKKGLGDGVQIFRNAVEFAEKHF